MREVESLFRPTHPRRLRRYLSPHHHDRAAVHRIALRLPQRVMRTSQLPGHRDGPALRRAVRNALAAGRGTRARIRSSGRRRAAPAGGVARRGLNEAVAGDLGAFSMRRHAADAHRAHGRL